VHWEGHGAKSSRGTVKNIKKKKKRGCFAALHRDRGEGKKIRQGSNRKVRGRAKNKRRGGGGLELPIRGLGELKGTKKSLKKIGTTGRGI